MLFFLHFCSSHIKNVNPNKHDELSEENKELEKINQKIEKHEIIERINIKEIESEILDETKALEEIEIKLSKLKTTIMKKRFWNEIDKQETLERTKHKTRNRKTKKSR